MKDQNISGAQLFDNLDLMTVDDVAQVLGKKPQTIRNMVAKREIPFIEGMRPTMFRKTSIARWLEQKEFKPCR